MGLLARIAKKAKSLMFADEANKVIDRINLIDTFTVSPRGFGAWKNDAAANRVLDLTPLVRWIQSLFNAAPFQIIPADIAATESTPAQARVRIITSTLAGDLPDGFSTDDDPPFYLDLEEGNNVIYGAVTWDVSGPTAGAVTSRSIARGSSLPTDSAGTFYYRIGSATVGDSKTAAVNDRYGPIPSQCLRVWFVWPKLFVVTNQ